MKSSQTPIFRVIRRDLQNMQVLKNSVGQIKQKSYFSTIALPIFFPPTAFLKIGIYTHPIDLSCHQKFEKNSPTRSGNISARSWKI